MFPRQQLTKIALLALAAVQLAHMVSLADGFSLFNGPLGLFHQQRHQQQQQQPQQSSGQQREQLLLAANSLAPIYGQLVGPVQNQDLLRLRALNPNNHHQGAHHFGAVEAALPTYYRPALSALAPAHLPTVAGGPQGFANFQRQQSALDEAAIMAAAQSQPPMRMEPSQSEVVDKIERHIGRQIERTLDGHDRVHQMADQLGQRMAAASGFQSEEKRAEKEAAASGEGHHDGEEEVHEEAQQPEKKKHHQEKEEHHKEEHHNEPEEHHHHEEHHHEHPPEAFEVHHKKGGKSFQYFHQGHQQHH